MIVAAFPAASRPHPVRFVFADPFPPFAYTENDRPAGFIIDLIGRIVALSGRRAEFIPAPLDRAPERLSSGNAEALAPQAITAQRLAEFDFSRPLCRTGGALFFPQHAESGQSLKDLAGQAVATPNKGPLKTALQTEFPEVAIIGLPDYPAALQAVLDGKASAAALNLHAGAMVAHRFHPGHFKAGQIFWRLDLAVAVLKNQQPALIETIDDGLAALKESGEMDRLYHSWFSGLET